MKKKSLIVILLALVLTASLFATACGKKNSGSSDKPKTLEEYAVKNPDVQKSIEQATSKSDVVVDIKDNNVIYSYELSKMEDYTEDVAKDPSVVENLQKTLDNAGATFGGIAKTLEDTTGISGIHVVVYYTYEGETVVTQTFDASDASAQSNASEEQDTDEENAESAEGDEGDSADGETEDGSSDDAS